MTITNVGNVGIGTSSPNDKLTVYGASTVYSDTVSGGTSGTNSDWAYHKVTVGGTYSGSVYNLIYGGGIAYTYYSANNGQYWVGTSQQSPLILYTNNAERMRIDNNGNVGIGTASTTAKLQFDNSLNTNKINFYRIPGDVYGIGLQSSQLMIYSGSGGNADGGVYLGKYDGTTFTENMRVRNRGAITTPNQPFARVYVRSVNNYSPTSGQIIVFNVADENIGNCFNTSTGRFTCPVDGTYMCMSGIQLSVPSNSSWTFNYMLHKNGNGIAGVYEGSFLTSYFMAKCYGIVTCAANDVLDFRILTNTTITNESAPGDVRNYAMFYLLG
jgi:hypothetical protein